MLTGPCWQELPPLPGDDVRTTPIRRRTRRALRAARSVALTRGGGVSKRLRAGGTVALTFDDGPDPVYTPLLLDALAEAGAPATFFVVGDAVVEHPDLVRRMIADGHAVGSHSRTHRDLAGLSLREVREEIDDGRRALRDVAGGDARLFRPPKGHLDAKVAFVTRERHLDLWLWSKDPHDWKPGATPDEIVASIGHLIGGDVVLLHDGIQQAESEAATDRSATIEAVPRIVALIRAAGLEPVRLS
jgi:peptidoglycan/xylan/chitin deacetylase (PgdA/CDA1 family)